MACKLARDIFLSMLAMFTEYKSHPTNFHRHLTNRGTKEKASESKGKD
jgi:hypothetical protein